LNSGLRRITFAWRFIRVIANGGPGGAALRAGAGAKSFRWPQISL